MSPKNIASQVQENVWTGRVPLEIYLDKTDSRTYKDTPILILFAHRISYLPLLLPRAHEFFKDSLIDPSILPSQGWFSCEDIPLKWHHPIGLLFDLYAGLKETLIVSENEPGGSQNDTRNTEPVIPWKLTVHFSGYPSDKLAEMDAQFKVLHDVFQNSVKEAAYVRHNTSVIIMSAGNEDVSNLWESVQKADVALFRNINHKLMYPNDRALIHVPLKIYLPSASKDSKMTVQKSVSPGHVQVVQKLVPPLLSNKQPRTLGTALNTLLPSIFPSRRSPLLAYPILHGAIVPMSAHLAELAEFACYADGFLHIALVMTSQ